MNYELNTTPAAVYTTFLTAVEAYEVGGTEAQALWMQGRAQAMKARRVESMQAAALITGAACTIVTALVVVFG